MKKWVAVLAAGVISVSFSQAFGQVSKVDDVKKALSTENKDTVCWVHGGALNIGLNEGFLHNWAAGGEIASMAINSIFNGYLTYYHHNFVWTNNLDMKYGLNYAFSNDFVPRKTDDQLDFTSKFGSQVKKRKGLYYTALLNFKSQFTHGFDYSMTDWSHKPTSGLFSPAYTTVAAGLEYRKGSKLTLFYSPIAARATFVDAVYTSMSKTGAFGVDSGKTQKYEFGSYFTGRYMVELSKVMSFNTRLDLYSNYLAKDTRDANGNLVKSDNPGNIQVFWDNLLTWKATKWLGLTVGFTVAYNNDNPYSKTYLTGGVVTDKNQPGENLGWIQIKQSIAFGLTYKF